MKIEISVRTALIASIACNTVVEMIDQLPCRELELLRREGFLSASKELDEALRAFDSDDEDDEDQIEEPRHETLVFRDGVFHLDQEEEYYKERKK